MIAVEGRHVLAAVRPSSKNSREDIGLDPFVAVYFNVYVVNPSVASISR